MKTKACLIIALLFCAASFLSVVGQRPTPTQTPQAQSTASEQVGKEKPDENKQEQVKVYQEMFDKLVDRATWVFGVVGGFMMLLGTVIVGLIWWTLGQSRKDAKLALLEEMKNRGLANVEGEYQKIQTQINALNAFKGRRIDWVFPVDAAKPADAAKPECEIAFLQRAGVQHVNPIPVLEDKPFILNNPDLLIFSHNRTPAASKLLKQIVELLKTQQLKTPLLLYAPGRERVPDDDMELLGETALPGTANFPATLVTHALELIRMNQN